MSDQDQVDRKIIEAVTRFENQSMAVRPDAVTISLSEPYLIVTLRGAISAAERSYAQERPSRELLEKLYVDVFDAAKVGLEATVAGILGRTIQRSRITIDPTLGDAILVFVLGQANPTKTSLPSGTIESPAY